MGGMSESQLAAVTEVATQEARRLSWSQDSELLASILETLQRIAARLDLGVPVGMVSKLKAIPTIPRIPRPEWVKEVEPAAPSGDGAAMSPREFFAMMRGG